MEDIVPKLRRCDKRRLKRRANGTDDRKLAIRYLIVLNLAEGRSASDTANSLSVSKSTVYRVAERYRRFGEAGLIDRREENGDNKLDECYLSTLWEVVESSPLEHGWKRPTWTREMLVETMWKKTGVRVHVSTMSRALGLIGARRGRPKPTVDCPWSKRAKNKRLREIERILEALPEDEVLVYEDEVDIHLNPKIGLDWMIQGQQKEVMTPGQNQKRYLAGAMDADTGELIWVEGESKNSILFIQLLWALHLRYPDAKRIHVILDNYSIHHTEQVKAALATETGQRIALHFLPPYCPDHNKIERVWQDLHANVTRNHRCSTMAELMKNTRAYLRTRNKKAQAQYRLAS
jgi:transposase